MTTTETTAHREMTKMVAQFMAAKHDADNYRLGTPRQERGEARMDRLVQKAERLGFLAEFCTTVTKEMTK